MSEGLSNYTCAAVAVACPADNDDSLVLYFVELPTAGMMMIMMCYHHDSSADIILHRRCNIIIISTWIRKLCSDNVLSCLSFSVWVLSNTCFVVVHVLFSRYTCYFSHITRFIFTFFDT